MSNVNNDSLIFAHVIFRHGERSIVHSYPNDPYKDEIHWPTGFGQLTNEGKRQVYRLGQYLRRRYNQLISGKYSPKKIYILSTDFDRTIMSAQACLAGLFPPTDEEKWHDDFMSWHPIPVHTTPWQMDYILRSGNHYQGYEAARKKYMENCPEIQRVFVEHANLFEHWSQKSGSTIQTLESVFQLYNTLITEKEHHKRLPNWAEEAIQANGTMEYIAKLFIKSIADTSELARLKSGFLIKEMMERFNQKINSTLQPDRSLWLYSAHDFTIANVLNAFGLFEPHFPPYAASLHLELYKTNGNEHYFQIYYRTSEADEHPVPILIPGCGEKCSMAHFYDLFKEIIPNDCEK